MVNQFNQFTLLTNRIQVIKMGKKINKKAIGHVISIPPVLALFNILFRSVVINKNLIPRTGPLVIMSNHYSHLDSFFVAFGCFPRFFRAFYFPSDVKLWKSPLFKVLLTINNTIPIFKQLSGADHASKVMRYMVQVLRQGESIIYFPEGARSKDGKLQPGKVGSGWLAHETQVPIIPCAVKNTATAMPVGRGFRIGGGPRRITLTIKFGPPVELADLYRKKKCLETSQLITDRIMADIKKLVDSL